MSTDKTPLGRALSGARPSQHISSIAHLFFDNNCDPQNPQKPASPKDILVVGTGRDTCAPYTAVGLGQHLLDQSTTVGERGNTGSTVPIRQVFFAETTPVCFSGVSQLQKGSFRRPAAGESVPWAVRQGTSPPVLRLFPGQVPSEDVSGGMVERCFYIRHLDLPSDAELGAWETQAASGHNSDIVIGAGGTLFWCVPVSSAVNLALVGRLGRFLKVSRPSCIHVLVYPDRGSSKQSYSSGAMQTQVQRCRRLVEYVADGTAVYSLVMGEASDQQGVQLASLSRQLSL